jgi:hypothetical protein
MASSPVTTAPIEHAAPAVAACPKCNLALVAAPLKRDHAVKFIAGLLVYLGVISCFRYLVAGLALIGLGIFVATVGGRDARLVCPECGLRVPHGPE